MARLIQEADPAGVVRGTADTSLGTLRYVIIPVAIEGDDSTGSYVSAYNLDAELEEITEAFRTYAWVAAGALVIVGLVGWFVAGRLLRPDPAAAAHGGRDRRERLHEPHPGHGHRRRLRAHPQLQRHARPARSARSTPNAGCSTT